MAIRDKYFPGTSVSRYLPPGELSWDEEVYQSGKPVLDAELNLSQEVGRQIQRLVRQRTVPSGWLRGPIESREGNNFDFPIILDADFAADGFYMSKRTALVAGAPIVVEYTNTITDNLNLIQLDAATVYGGTSATVKRTDFVFLEVWRCLVSHSPRATATVTVADPLTAAAVDTILINGTVLTAVWGAPGVDEFQIGATADATAVNIRAAINAVANTFTGICTAEVDVSFPNQVNLRAADPFAGAAGNAITLSVVVGVAGALVPSGATFAGGVDMPNKPTQTTIYRQGNVDAPAAVNLPDNIADPTVGTETTKRVQWQYRIRATGEMGAASNINFKTQQDGFTNADVLAQGTQVAPVAGYQFVPADGTTVIATSSAVAYDTIDEGLWIAGDGTSAAATALGTVDGYVYAIPLCFVFRKNDAYDGGAGAGFSPTLNTNGALPSTHAVFANPLIGSIGVSESDRPDGGFCDEIVHTDVLDLRKQVSPGGVDLKAALEYQMSVLLDNANNTWAIDAADKNELGSGSGDVSWRFLVCNEVGRSSADGGIPAQGSGDTTRGDSIANFDHIRRRFADQPVCELVTLSFLPGDTIGTEPGKYVTQVVPGFTGWQEGDVLNLDLGMLNATTNASWANASATYTGGVTGGVVSGFWPPGTAITDVTVVHHDDGELAAVSPADQSARMDLVTGMGTDHLQITLDFNDTTCDGGGDPLYPAGHIEFIGSNPAVDSGSVRRIFVQVEITYPAGSGTTDTPWLDGADIPLVPSTAVYPRGAILENPDALGSPDRPDDWEDLLAPEFRPSHREVGLEYITNRISSGIGSGTPVNDSFVSADPTNITFLHRIYGSKTMVGTPNVTDAITTLARSVDTNLTRYGSSRRMCVLEAGTPLSGTGNTLANVTYFPQEAIPNYGTNGYQVSAYYRSAAPQTLGSQGGIVSLPTTLEVQPLAMSRDLWSGTVSVGSTDTPFPYLNPSDQIPVTSDIPPSEFGAEWFLMANSAVSVGDFDADTGLLNLHQMVPVDGTQNFTFSSPDKDAEFRAHYNVSDDTAYRPTAMAQPLSGPACHKMWFPFLARATSNSTMWRANEVLLLVVSRYGVLDADNVIRFTDTENETCVGVYRTQGLLVLASE